MPERSGFGAAATATLMAPRSQELASGSVRFWRWPLTIGPAYRVPVGAAALDLHAGVALAWLHVEGSEFVSPSPETRNAIVGGGFVSTRISKAWGRFEPFVDVTGVVWSTDGGVR